MNKFLLLCVAVIIGSPAALAELTAREQLDCFADGLESLSGQFTQVVTGPDGEFLEMTEGDLNLMHPDRFRWDYRGEYPQTIVADGSKVWIHDLELEQVTVKDQSELAGDSPLMVLIAPEQLDEQFTVEELGDIDQQQYLALSPLGEQKEFERILLGLTDNDLKTLILEDAFGQRTRIQFIGLERNTAVDQALFDFEPPADSDVIGLTE